MSDAPFPNKFAVLNSPILEVLARATPPKCRSSGSQNASAIPTPPCPAAGRPLLHQAHSGQVIRETGRATAQHLNGFERPRRQATLVAVTFDPVRRLAVATPFRCAAIR